MIGRRVSGVVLKHACASEATYARNSIRYNSTMPKSVEIVEVGPRDGLQNEKFHVPMGDKIQLIQKLSASGIKRIEAGSFVSPNWVPQMADTPDIFEYLLRNGRVKNSSSSRYSALTPNIRGLQKAKELGVEEVAIFGAASESFSQKNINCDIETSIDRFTEVCEAALDHGIRVRGYVSCVLGCPYEGAIDPQIVAAVTKRMLDLGCYEISLGDTIGVGDPKSTRVLLDTVLASGIPADKLAVHFHDTYGMAIANILVALEKGIKVIDSSVSGLGGCPYAQGASGNVATEDVVYLLDGLGIKHNVDLSKLLEAQTFIDKVLNRESKSKVALALAKKVEDDTTEKMKLVA